MIDLTLIRDSLRSAMRAQMQAHNVPGTALAFTDRVETPWVAVEGREIRFGALADGLALSEDQFYELA
jgi:hypothetical protein